MTLRIEGTLLSKARRSTGEIRVWVSEQALTRLTVPSSPNLLRMQTLWRSQRIPPMSAILSGLMTVDRSGTLTPSPREDPTDTRFGAARLPPH
jgi:hypothetical protein